MKRNFKFLSSLAITGMLATSVVGIPTFAATTENTTKTEPVGIYQQLVTGKKVVPFVLADREDKVTIKDIKDSGKFNMVQFKELAIDDVDDQTIVATGDTFKVSGESEEYTVVIYGDVDGDGSITILDALAIQQNRAKLLLLEDVQLEAANVVRADNSKVNIIDALHIQQYRAKLTENIIDQLPEAEQPSKPVDPSQPTDPEEPGNENIKSITVEKAVVDNYYRYEENPVCTVSSVDGALTADLLKKTKLEGTNKDSAELVYDEVDGKVQISLYATKAGEYTITPIVNGETNLTDGALPKITVKENEAVTDVRLVSEKDGEIKSVKPEDALNVSLKEGKEKDFSIKLYHTYYDKNGSVAEENDITASAAARASLEKVTTNAIDDATTLLRENNQSLHINSKAVGNDELKIKVTNDAKYGIADFAKIINVTVEELKMQGITIDGPEKVENKTATLAKGPIALSLYTKEPTNNPSFEVKLEDDGKYYTILPIAQMDNDGEGKKIVYSNINKTPITNKQGKIAILENGASAIDIATLKKYSYNAQTKQYEEVSSTTQEIDAIGIAIGDATDAAKNLKAKEVTINFDGLNGREAIKIEITLPDVLILPEGGNPNQPSGGNESN